MSSFDEVTTRLLQEAEASANVASPLVTAIVTEGPDAGKRFELRDVAHREVFFGKSAACDVCVADPSASRRHFALRLEADGLVLRDVGSSNGTFVNRVQVREAVLRGGESITLGTTTLLIELGEEEHVLEASNASAFGRVVGASAAMRRLYVTLEKLASLDVPVLIEGEPGTGKELVAEAIHEHSARKDGPYATFDCTGSNALEAEVALFGRAGEDARAGILESARGGTVFVDEITELATPLQLRLMRAIEKRSSRRMGGEASFGVDVRLIASTRRDPEREVTSRKLREELLAIFTAARITLPPLRRRRGDIALLTRFFFARFGADPALVPAELLARFEEQPWMGNVRELSRAVARHLTRVEPERATSPGDEPEPEREELDARFDFVDAVIREGLPIARAREKVVAWMEQRYLRHVLEQHGGNVTRAAAFAGVTRRHFYTLKGK